MGGCMGIGPEGTGIGTATGYGYEGGAIITD